MSLSFQDMRTPRVLSSAEAANGVRRAGFAIFIPAHLGAGDVVVVIDENGAPTLAKIGDTSWLPRGACPGWADRGGKLPRIVDFPWVAPGEGVLQFPPFVEGEDRIVHVPVKAGDVLTVAGDRYFVEQAEAALAAVAK